MFSHHSFPVALLVVSIRLLSLYKMAEIRPIVHEQQWGPESKSILTLSIDALIILLWKTAFNMTFILMVGIISISN